MVAQLRLAGARLRKRLEALPDFAGRKVRILSTAAGGYKQPQQLLSLAFYLSSGGPLDILINLDGFNEVAALNINIQNRVHPAYPVFWWEVTRDFGGSEDLQRASALHLLRRSRSLLADAAEHLKGSVTASLIWRLSDRALERRIYTTAAELPPATEAPAFSRGPPFPSSPAEQRKRSVEIWANSSRAMQGLAESHGFAYYHFLQPNQYVRSARVFTREEQKRALSNRNYAEIIPRWYPKLRLGGEQLERRGVAFFDLSFIFDDVEETVFDDDCCHLNPRGRRRLVDEIVKRIGMQ